MGKLTEGTVTLYTTEGKHSPTLTISRVNLVSAWTTGSVVRTDLFKTGNHE
jgi:hypothetical protein